jgi:hypothetical protein
MPCANRDGALCKSLAHRKVRAAIAVICQIAFRMKVATSCLVSAMLFLHVGLFQALDQFLHFGKLVRVQLIALD